MKIYTFGAEDAPVLLLLPGTCCHWKSNFGAVIPLLADSFRVLCVSYDGFDETEQTEFPTMLEETEKIEAYLKTHCGGHIRAAYGCSLGGSFVGLLAARKNIHMDYGILGSSDLDQASPLTASLQTDFLLPLMRPSFCWTRPPQVWMLRTKRRFRRLCPASSKTRPFSSSLTGCVPWQVQTRLLC